jgi:hypothetical protein
MRRGLVYLSLTSHRTEAREALEGPSFAGFPHSSGISSSSATQCSLCGSSKGTNLRNTAEIGGDRQPDPRCLQDRPWKASADRPRVSLPHRYLLAIHSILGSLLALFTACCVHRKRLFTGCCEHSML